MEPARSYLVIAFLLFGCSARPVPTCTMSQIERVGVVETVKEASCKCECPKENTPLDAGGIVGGLMNLFGE